MYSLPNAKINIGLNIVERRPDGYHNLQTVFYPIPLTDSLELKPTTADEFEFLSSGLNIAGQSDDNLVVKVYKSLASEFDLPPVEIHLSKHIPMGAGLGGGSSDAAFMMRMLCEHFDLRLTDADMERRLAAFGADCPFFIRNKAVYAQGIGNQFTPIKLSLKGYHIVLVKPQTHVSTAEAYSAVRPEQPAHDLVETLTTSPIEEWRNLVFNDFEKSVFPLHPEISAIKQTLYDMGALYASMSGSGSAVYGIFNRPIDNAATIFPHCFTFASMLN